MGMTVWGDLDTQARDDLTAWFNLSPLDESDKARLAKLLADGRFYAWDCPACGNRCYCGSPEGWSHFQGVLQINYASFPGNNDIHTDAYNVRLCDNCRMSSVEQEPKRPPVGVAPY